MPDVSIDRLSFTYAGTSKPILREINLTIAPGEMVLLTGPSGCGKSTLALALAGLIPTRISGELRGGIFLDGTNISRLNIHEISQQVGIVFQNPDNQLVQLSVEEEVAFGPENLALPPEEIEKRIGEALAATGMLAMRHEQIYALSGGQKQRVAIAATLAMRPQVLVLDEPTSDLDPVGAQEVLSVLSDLNTQHGMTIILIEHKIDEVIPWVHRVLLMDEGAVALDAPPATAFRQLSIWHEKGVSVPQMAQVAHGLPEVFSGGLPLTVESVLDALRGTPFARALQAMPREASLSDLLASPPPNFAGPALLEWKNVNLAYDRNQVLFDVTMQIWSQEWTALIGANGSGKTSLASLVMGFQGPTSGEIAVEGKPVKSGNVSRQARTLAYLFQSADTMLFTSTVENELRFGQQHRNRQNQNSEFTLEHILEITGLEPYRATNPFHLSHGQRKRLALGALLTRQPKTLILDEPTTGQDEGHARTFLRFLDGVRSTEGLTYLMITHDMRAVATYATRLLVLRAGRIVLNGPPAEIFARRAELHQCGILPPPIAQLHARLCNDETPRVALNVPDFLRQARAAEVMP
jgi:energy-coupling factor transport system ATP-binding protein